MNTLEEALSTLIDGMSFRTVLAEAKKHGWRLLYDRDSSYCAECGDDVEVEVQFTTECARDAEFVGAFIGGRHPIRAILGDEMLEETITGAVVVCSDCGTEVSDTACIRYGHMWLLFHKLKQRPVVQKPGEVDYMELGTGFSLTPVKKHSYIKGKRPRPKRVR